jgi:hypothetical protein
VSNSEKPVVITAASQVLAHVPGLARHGSKPQRELPKDEELEEKFLSSLRSFEAAVAYPPHQAYLGAFHPRELPERPWTDVTEGGDRFCPAGELMPEEEFFGLMAAADEFDLLKLDQEVADRAAEALSGHPLAKAINLEHLEKAVGNVEKIAKEEGVLSLHNRDRDLVAVMRSGQLDDDALKAHVLLENLSAKTTACLALLHLLDKQDIDPASIDYVIACGEEAVGDRYQRGGGNLAKGVAGYCGLSEASGADVKNFCAAFIPSLVFASSLVHSGVFERIAIVAGGSFAKLGMKFQGHLKHGLPVMEDVLGGAAVIVERDDDRSPLVRLDAVGRHKVSHGGSTTQVMQALAFEPLERLELPTTEVDDFATELHNPEITEPQGSGNVPERNYKTMAALAARRGDIEREDIDEFVKTRGMPGYSPTQGHLASAWCYLPHALKRLTEGDADKVMLLAKGSLFLGRLSQLADGMSVLIERNPGGND